MFPTYLAILDDNRVEWSTDPPPALARRVRVHVTLLDNPPVAASPDQGARMASVLELIANRGGLTAITDPLAWEREQREDRELPGRTE